MTPTVPVPPGAEDRVVEITAKCRLDGVRLDQYLVGVFPDFSRSVVQRVIDGGGVAVNGKPAKASYKVRHGDVIRVTPPEPTHPLPVAEDIPLDILYEDEFLAVVNKPADMVVHPAKGHWSGTLVNALRFHFDQLSGAQRRLPGRHRPSPRPRHQRRHPHRQGGADAPRPEPAVRDSARSSRNTSPSRPACSTATAITSRAASATIRTTASR